MPEIASALYNISNTCFSHRAPRCAKHNIYPLDGCSKSLCAAPTNPAINVVFCHSRRPGTQNIFHLYIYIPNIHFPLGSEFPTGCYCQLPCETRGPNRNAYGVRTNIVLLYPFASWALAIYITHIALGVELHRTKDGTGRRGALPEPFFVAARRSAHQRRTEVHTHTHKHRMLD